MTKKWLGNLLQDNTLVDNQTYIIQDGVLTNCRLPEDITLHQKTKKDKEIWECTLDCVSLVD